MLVVDEVPDCVYRVAKLSVRARGTGRRVSWRVEPLDTLEEKLKATYAETDHWPQVKPILKRIAAQRRLLLKRAQETKARTAGRHARMAATIDPLLSPTEFAVLTKLPSIDDIEAFEYEDDDQDTDYENAGIPSILMTLRDFVGESALRVFFEHTFTKNRPSGTFYVHRPVSGWVDLMALSDGSRRPVVVLDATAGVDPRYGLLSGDRFEVTPKGLYPNLTIVLTSQKTVAKKDILDPHTTEWEGVNKLIADVAPYRRGIQRLLVVTPKKFASRLRAAVAAAVRDGTLPGETTVVHFGSLRGRNNFRHYDAIYLTNLHRLPDWYYAGLAFLLHDFERFPGKFEAKGVNDSWDVPAIRWRAIAADLYQDAMRIKLRQSTTSRCFIFIPSMAPALLTRVMRLFEGARIVRPGETAPTVEVEARVQQSPTTVPIVKTALPVIVPSDFHEIRAMHPVPREAGEELQRVAQALWDHVRTYATSVDGAVAEMKRLLVARGPADLVRSSFVANGTEAERARAAAFEIIAEDAFGQAEGMMDDDEAMESGRPAPLAPLPAAIVAPEQSSICPDDIYQDVFGCADCGIESYGRRPVVTKRTRRCSR
jgi:hypothetical protein